MPALLFSIQKQSVLPSAWIVRPRIGSTRREPGSLNPECEENKRLQYNHLPLEAFYVVGIGIVVRVSKSWLVEDREVYQSGHSEAD